MKQLLIGAMNMGARYSVRYTDNPKSVFTIPVLLTIDRIEMLQDHSIDEIRLHFNDSQWMED